MKAEGGGRFAAYRDRFRVQAPRNSAARLDIAL
jgi:hypothetical protein